MSSGASRLPRSKGSGVTPAGDRLRVGGVKDAPPVMPSRWDAGWAAGAPGPHLLSPPWPWQRLHGIFQLCPRGSRVRRAEKAPLLIIDWRDNETAEPAVCLSCSAAVTLRAAGKAKGSFPRGGRGLYPCVEQPLPPRHRGVRRDRERPGNHL